MKKFILLLLLATTSCSTGPRKLPELNTVQTAQVTTEKAPTKIAFASCSHQKNPQPIWETMLDQKPELYIGMGDNVYASKPEDQPILEQYKIQAQVPEFKKFRSQVPVIGVWDDHDFGLNDGGDKNSKHSEAKQAYLQFFPFDAQKIPASQMGVQHAILFGQAPQRINVILLDTRTYRSDLEANPNPKTPLDKFSPTKDKSKTVLGGEQWKWLEKELRRPAEIVLLVSSIQVLPEKHGFEKWANFPHERTRLLNLIKKTKVKNLVILSGDRHLAEVSKLNLPGYGELFEMTASSINRPSGIENEENPLRVGSLYGKENFGLLSINWESKDLAVELKDAEGKKLNEFSLKMKN